MLKLSLSSRVLDWIGRTFIASTEALKMPTDFYHIPGDRLLPSSTDYAQPKTRPQRIAVDAFRRRLMVGVAFGASGIAVVASALAFLLARVAGLAH